MQKTRQFVDVSQVAVIIYDDKCLILEDAASPGKWLLPGGRIDEGEDQDTAFRRELKEEIGLTQYKNLGLVDFDVWYQENEGKSGVAYLVQVDNNEVVLSPEHLQYRWISEDEIDSFQYVWRNANRMLKRGFAVYR